MFVKRFNVGQHRWVEYKNWMPDASQVPPGWHAWLQYVSDKAPGDVCTLKV